MIQAEEIAVAKGRSRGVGWGGVRGEGWWGGGWTFLMATAFVY